MAPYLNAPPAYRSLSLLACLLIGEGSCRNPAGSLPAPAQKASTPAMHVGLQVDLLASDSAEIAGAITSLEFASTVTNRTATALAESAAAHLFRAERSQSPRDVLATIDAATRATELEPNHQVGLLYLARGLSRFGLKTEARATLRRFEAAVLVGEAKAVLRAHPRRATTLLDSAIGSTSEPAQLAEVLVIRSEARIVLGDLHRAATDLQHVADHLRERPGGRELLTKRMQTTYRMLLMGYVSSGHTTDALELVESVAAAGTPRIGQQAMVNLLTRSQSQPQTAIRYTLIGDTLLTWTLARGEIHLLRSVVSQQHLLLIRHGRLALEFHQSDDVLLPHLQALYEWLIRPVQALIGPPGTPLVIITDGKLGDVPFSALRDASKGRYLLEDHSLRFAQNLTEAFGNEHPTVHRRGRLLIVADPAFDMRAHPGLGRLPGASLEADMIANEYTGVELVKGEQAHQSAVETRLRRATILHFAGHAFYDDRHPAQSALVLATSRSFLTDDVLTASEIERLDLSHVQLVVLAACETLRSTEQWPEKLQGLATAMLSAGADGVVGTGWRVEDDLTRPLMIRFHRAYRASGDAAASIRVAQLAALRSRNPRLRSPAAWAAFRYMAG